MKTISEILKIKYPIIQGGMTMIADAKLASAVSNAGGLGVLASAGMSASKLREEIKKTKELTEKPFAVNLMLMSKNIPELIEVIIEENVKIVSTGAGTPKPYMEILKANDIKVIAVIPNSKIAKKMEEIGVDIVVAEGMESGGHIGELTTLSLVPQVAKAVNIPVVAAGGIATGSSILAMFALGAKGVQLGTLFLTAKECLVSNEFKKAILNATDSSTVVLSRKKGIPFRAIKNNFSIEYLNAEQNDIDIDDLNELKIKGLTNSLKNGDAENGIVMAGQIAGIIEEEKTVKEIIETLFEDFNKNLVKLSEIQ